MSFISAFYFVKCFVEIARKDLSNKFFLKLCGYFFVANTIVMLLRAVWALIGPPIGGDAMNAGPISYLLYAWLVVFCLGLTMLFVLMTAERLSAELTERVKELDEAHRAAITMLTEQRNFLTMVSHEFRTPLGIIQAAGDVIRRYLTTASPEIAVELDRIRRAGTRLGNLVERCLSDEWLNMASDSHNFVVLNLGSLVTDIAREMDVTVSIEGGEPLRVSADQFLLPVVFTNLIDNARKFATEPKAITVKAARDGDGAIVIEVADDGPGVNSSETSRIFEKFYRSPDAARKPGAGLGLYLARKIVTLHGGTIELDQTAGTVFRVKIPPFER